MKRLLIIPLLALALHAQTQVYPPASGTGASLPDQTNNAGKFLTTNGSAASWGSVSSGKLVATFLLCAGPCAANETSNWKWTAPFAVTVSGCILDAGTYPTGTGGTAITVYKNGTTNSIFASTVPTLAGGASAYNEQTSMHATYSVLAKGDYLVAKVTTVAGTVTGQFLNAVCTVTY